MNPRVLVPIGASVLLIAAAVAVGFGGITGRIVDGGEELPAYDDTLNANSASVAANESGSWQTIANRTDWYVGTDLYTSQFNGIVTESSLRFAHPMYMYNETAELTLANSVQIVCPEADSNGTCIYDPTDKDEYNVVLYRPDSSVDLDSDPDRMATFGFDVSSFWNETTGRAATVEGQFLVHPIMKFNKSGPGMTITVDWEKTQYDGTFISDFDQSESVTVDETSTFYWGFEVADGAKKDPDFNSSRSSLVVMGAWRSKVDAHSSTLRMPESRPGQEAFGGSGQMSVYGDFGSYGQ